MSILLALDNATIQEWANVAKIVGGVLIVVGVGIGLWNKARNKPKQ